MKIQDGFALRQGDGGGKMAVDGLLHVGDFLKGSSLPFDALFLRQEALHFLFEQAAAAGILAGNGGLFVIHPVVYLPPALHLGLVLGPLLAGDLLLLIQAEAAGADIIGIAQGGDGMAGDGFPPHLLEMEDDGGGVFQQGFVVGDEQNGPGRLADKALQPFQGGDIQVIGGFVQQQDVGIPGQQTGQAGFHLLAARQAARGALAFQPVGGQLQLPQQAVIIDVHPVEEGAQRQAAFLLRHFLGEVAQAGCFR